MMQRAGLIQILDTRPEQEDQTEETEESLYRRWLHVLIKEPNCVHDQRDFAKVIEPCRNYELARLIQGLQQLRDVVQHYSQTRLCTDTRCLGYMLIDVYPRAALSCGGCPYDRQVYQEPYSFPICVEANVPAVAVDANQKLVARVASAPYLQGNLNVVWHESQIPVAKILRLLETLISVGFTQVIVPDEIATEQMFAAELVRLAGGYPQRRQRLLSESLFTGPDDHVWTLYPMPTVVVYPPDSRRADRIYQRAKTPGAVPRVSVVQRSLYLLSEHGLFLDRVNGLQWTVEMLRDRIFELRDAL
jgi:hypothetical protein